MLAKKITIDENMIRLITETRKKNHMTAYELSEKIGKNKSWLANIENSRVKSLKKKDFLLIFEAFAAEEELETELFILKYLHPNAIVELETGEKVPCHVLQAKYSLSSGEDYGAYQEALSQQNGPQTPSPWSKNGELDFKLRELAETIGQQYTKAGAAEQKNILEMVEQMDHNLRMDFALTESLYRQDLYQDADVNEKGMLSKKYAQGVSDMIATCWRESRLLAAKACAFGYFDPEYSVHTITKQISECHSAKDRHQAQAAALDRLEQFSMAIYRYTELAEKEKTSGNTEVVIAYEKLYRALHQAILQFLAETKLQYDFSFEAPKDDAPSDEIRRKRLEINGILFEVKQMFSLL